ncbi:MAG: carboxypeptidase-like regulatory domain-containing protein [Planctomycetota bacterium]
MTQRQLVPALFFLAIAAGLGFLLLRGEARSSTGDAMRKTSGVVDAAAELAPAGALESAGIPVEKTARRVMTTGPARGLEAATEARFDATSIVGRVVDENGGPVANAAVRAAKSAADVALHEPAGQAFFDAGIGVATTAADGTFRVERRAGPACLSVRAAGFAPATVRGISGVAAGTTRLDADIVLERSALVRGVVLDDTGVPVGDARVIVRELGHASRRTAADGSFRFDQLPRTPLTLLVTHASHVSREVDLDARQPFELPLVTIRMPRGGVIEGRVQGPSAQPLETLVVAAKRSIDGGMDNTDDRIATLDEGGSFRLRGLAADERWQVFALPAAKVVGNGTPYAGLADRVSDMLVVGTGARNVALTLEATSTVSFRVVDKATRAPVESLATRLGSSRWVWTDLYARPDLGMIEEYVDGRVRLAGLRPDDEGHPLTLQVDALNYESYTLRRLVLEPGQELDLGTIELVPSPRMIVTVLDARDARPVPGVQVGWTEQDQELGAEFVESMAASEGEAHVPWRRRSGGYRSALTAHTDEQGRAAFEGRPGSTVELTATAPGFASAHVTDWELPVAGEAEYVIRLEQGAAVDVLALDAEGDVLTGRTIEQRLCGLSFVPARFSLDRAFSIDPERSHAVTDSGGRVRFPNLAPGRHEFRIRARGESGVVHVAQAGVPTSSAGWTAIDVSGEQVLELVLTEGPRGALFGRISAAGRPLDRARVGLFPKPKPDSRVSHAFEQMAVGADALGRYRIEDVEPGEYVLSIRHVDLGSMFDQDVTVTAGATRRDVEIGVGVVAGRVVDPEGRGVAGVLVSVVASDEGVAERRLLTSRDGGVFEQPLGAGAVRTDASGAWEIGGVAAGVDLIAIARGGAADWQSACSRVLTLSPDQRLDEVVLVVHPSGSLRVRLLRKDGSAVPLAFVTLTRSGDPEADRIAKSFSDSAGEIEALAPGLWKLEAMAFGPGGRVDREIEISAGGTVEVDIVFPDGRGRMKQRILFVLGPPRSASAQRSGAVSFWCCLVGCNPSNGLRDRTAFPDQHCIPRPTRFHDAATARARALLPGDRRGARLCLAAW